MGLWLNSGERGIVFTQAGLKWVTIGPIPGFLLRTFGPNIVGGNPAQHFKKYKVSLYIIFYKLSICNNQIYE